LRPLPHAIASLASTGLVYGLTRSLPLSALHFTAGVFIDLDHVPEYLCKVGRRNRFRDFLADDLHLKGQRTVFLFHGFDLALILLLVLIASGHALAGWAIFTGAVLHLLMDTLYNPIKSPFAYFFLYRLANRFQSKRYLYMMTMKEWREFSHNGRFT